MKQPRKWKKIKQFIQERKITDENEISCTVCHKLKFDGTYANYINHFYLSYVIT